MKDSKGIIRGVFKPNDEEPNAPHNPKGCAGYDGSFKGVKEGTIAGEGAVNECAAYLLDKNHFSSVPYTTLAKCSSAVFRDDSKPEASVKDKIGSLQEFVEHDSSCEDMGPSAFPKNEVHKIGILDVRMFNTDRHLGNILVKKTEDAYRLTPIDHGLCLPSSLSDALFEWITWPQAKQPFDKELLQYIEDLDADEDIDLLRRHLPIRAESLKTLKICTMLLKKCAREGFTLYDIGMLMCRMNNLGEKSDLELLVERAEQTEQQRGGDFYDALAIEIDRVISHRKENKREE